MGQYLSQPSTEKESEEGYADALAYGLSAMQGWRVSMEDAHIAELDLDPATKTSLFSVFDGHGGRAVSQFCAMHLAEEFVRSEAYRRGDLATAITEAYFRLDELLDSEEGRAELRRLSGEMTASADMAKAVVANGGSGSTGEEEEEEHHAAGMGATAVSVVVRGNRVVVANTGDSRCVLSKRGQARALTLDHKPILFEEAKRIIKAGGFVRDNRINGALNVSRTIGDLDFKRNAELSHREQMVVATPDIEQFSLEEGDEFLIVACDGIWDVLTNQEAVDFVRKRLKAGESLKSICEQMCDACLAPDLKGLCRGADNMSVIVLLFK
ncbi:hypothetical protein CHLNCDRAFT_9625, partial [Chlorella variabilis]